MANLNVDALKAEIIGGGARPNLFQVTITWPSGITTGGTSNSTNDSFFIKMASLPGSTVANIPVPFRGRTLQLAGDRTFEPWSITVINDTGMKLRTQFEKWMNGMNSHVSNTSQALNPITYKSDLTVTQLKKDGGTGRAYQIFGAFPTAISAIELDYGSENVIEEFSVEFNLDYWTNDATDQQGSTANATGGSTPATSTQSTTSNPFLQAIAGIFT